MCGIVGYVGPDRALPIILEGLRRLEYRGYDSSGVALLDGDLTVVKRAGKLSELDAALDDRRAPSGTVGIGHTRWATHGAPTDVNAHPHTDCDGRIAVIHNGIVENHAELRAGLEKRGHGMRSETDTEVVAHMLEERSGSLPDRVREVVRELEGAFALVVVSTHDPDVIVGVKVSSPLVVGLGERENVLASDIPAVLERTRRVVPVDERRVVEVRADAIRVTDFDGAEVAVEPFEVDWDVIRAKKGGYDDFMRKEIDEHPAAIRDTLVGRLDERGLLSLDELHIDEDVLRDVDKVFVVACGTAYHSGLVAKYAIEHWTRLPVEIDIASEFRYRDPVLGPDTLVIAISQSGETADTLGAVRYARRQRARVLTVCNTVGASIPRESDAVLYTRAGPEVCVAATKTFATQLAAMYLVSLYLAQVRGTMFTDEVAAVVRELEQIPAKVELCLERTDQVRKVAGEYKDAHDWLFLGRHVGYPMALEGALKLKEISYLHAEGYPAAELKHGPIALIEDGTPVVVVHPSSHVYAKMLTNIQEVAARGAAIIAIAEDGDREVAAHATHVLRVPPTAQLLAPLVCLIPLQLLSYHVAVARGCPIDKPRNLAKSVTVE